MFHVGKLLFISVLAIGLGVFLGTVPLADGLTAAEHSEAFFDRDSAPRSQIHAAKRIESRQAARIAAPKNARATSRQSARAASTKPKASPAQVATTRTAPPPAAIAEPPAAPMAPITAGAANSPEQASASDKAALDRIISGKTGR